MTDPVLYSFRRCPYAIRARMALTYANIHCELREIWLRDKPGHMLEVSPKGTVPVLITTDGQVIDESLNVMLWALQQHDPHNWLDDLTPGMDWINRNDQQFKPLLDAYKYVDRYPEKSPEQHREFTLGYLNDLDNQLTTSKWLVSHQVTLADIALMPFIRQYALVDKRWFDQQPWPHLHKWLNRLLNSDLFTISMTKFKLFNDGNRYAFPTGLLISETSQD